MKFHSFDIFKIYCLDGSKYSSSNASLTVAEAEWTRPKPSSLRKTKGAEQNEKLLQKLFNPNVVLLLHWLSFPPHPSQMRFCASFHQEYYYTVL